MFTCAMGGRKHSSEYHVRHAGCRAPSAGERKMREKVHLLACAQVVFFAVSLVGFLLGVPPAGRGLRLGGPYGSGLAECVSAGACLFPPEVVSPSVFLPGRASFLRKWSRRVCFCRGVPLSSGSGLAECVSAGACLFPPEVVQSSVFLPEVVALEVPPGGGVWRPDVAIGRWNRPVCRLELAGLRAGSSFVAKKRKL